MNKSAKLLQLVGETKAELEALQSRLQDTNAVDRINQWVKDIMAKVKAGEQEGQAKLDLVADIEDKNFGEEQLVVNRFIKGLKDIAFGRFV